MKRLFFYPFLLCCLTFLAFLPVGQNAFVDFDDPDYITQNPHVATGLSMDNICYAFTHAHAYNWHPLTWISHMLDVSLFGLNPAGHHLISAAFHALNAALLFILLRTLTGNTIPAAFVSALFALHPLRVESVAWASERKDVLSTFFFFLTLLSYVSYARTKRFWIYGLTLLFHLAGLLAKQMTVTLPLICLLLDYWPLRRFSFAGVWRRLTLEKIPLFLLSLGAGLTVYYVQLKTGVLHGEEIFPLSWRLSNAVYSLVAYLGKMFFPINLSVFYPHPLGTLSPYKVLLFALFLAALTGAVFLSRRPYLIVGWLWYLITIIPVLGLIQVGIQGMADRYTYLPSIGLTLAVVWGLEELLQGKEKLRKAAFVLGISVLMLFSVLTVKQIGVWQNSYTLYRHSAAVIPDNYWAYNNLGAVLFSQGKVEEAKALFERTLLIMPDYPGAHKNLAAILYREGRLREALEHMEHALKIEPKNPEFLAAKGAILLKMGDKKGAKAAFLLALSLNPNYPDALEGLRESEER